MFYKKTNTNFIGQKIFIGSSPKNIVKCQNILNMVRHLEAAVSSHSYTATMHLLERLEKGPDHGKCWTQHTGNSHRMLCDANGAAVLENCQLLQFNKVSG